MADLIVEVRLEGASAVVVAAGEIDVYQAPRLREVLEGLPAGATGPLVIDLTGVSYIDSTGLGTLVAARKRRVAEGSTVRLVCPDPTLRKVFEITGLVSFFTMVDSVEAALAASGDGV
ncbi:MAG: STAS domain-containing protein [Armatimonadota bacterium]